MAIDTTGEVFKIQGEIKFEWRVEDFLDHDSDLDEWYESPEFNFCGVSWVIDVYPYGKRKDASVGYISLFLESRTISEPITMNMSLSFKTVDEKSVLEKTSTYRFDKGSYNGWPKFILRSDLIKHKSELLPSGVLTVICTLKNSERDVSENTARKARCWDATTQTMGTGVWKLQQHLKEISLNGDISDVILKVEDQEFKSHKCILAARSPVFSAMMKNEMKEHATDVVEIQDVDPQTFSDFLNYLYTGSTEDLTSENVTKLYTLADKYQVKVLKEHCMDHMLVNVSIENFCDVFSLSLQHEEENLKNACIDYFVENSLNIAKTSKWQSFLCGKPKIGNELFIKYLELNEN